VCCAFYSHRDALPLKGKKNPTPRVGVKEDSFLPPSVEHVAERERDKNLNLGSVAAAPHNPWMRRCRPKGWGERQG
jgi:hypothetical protein